MLEDLEILKSLSLMKGRINYDQYLSVLKDVSKRLKIGHLSKKADTDKALKELILRTYKVGGKRRAEYISVLKSVLSKKKIKVLEDGLGEIL